MSLTSRVEAALLCLRSQQNTPVLFCACSKQFTHAQRPPVLDSLAKLKSKIQMMEQLLEVRLLREPVKHSQPFSSGPYGLGRCVAGKSTIPFRAVQEISLFRGFLFCCAGFGCSIFANGCAFKRQGQAPARRTVRAAAVQTRGTDQPVKKPPLICFRSSNDSHGRDLKGITL